MLKLFFSELLKTASFRQQQLKALCNRVRPLLSHLRGHLTTYSSNHLYWFDPKNFLIKGPIILKQLIKISENGHENKATIWTKFKIFFAWLTGRKKLTFYQKIFFGSGHFLVNFLSSDRSKNGRSQKSYNSKKLVFSCLSTTWRNFRIWFILCPCFHDHFLKFWSAVSK